PRNRGRLLRLCPDAQSPIAHRAHGGPAAGNRKRASGQSAGRQRGKLGQSLEQPPRNGAARPQAEAGPGRRLLTPENKSVKSAGKPDSVAPGYPDVTAIPLG